MRIEAAGPAKLVLAFEFFGAAEVDHDSPAAFGGLADFDFLIAELLANPPAP